MTEEDEETNGDGLYILNQFVSIDELKSVRLRRVYDQDVTAYKTERGGRTFFIRHVLDGVGWDLYDLTQGEPDDDTWIDRCSFLRDIKAIIVIQTR